MPPHPSSNGSPSILDLADGSSSPRWPSLGPSASLPSHAPQSPTAPPFTSSTASALTPSARYRQ
ncbi:hypothetical protein Syun_007204 [Stephania yunnanensis]|uniref:Uncharacterized protein n=1 Tax=Stephania yunnanensis TaxID=152371 RepID=A0AAP0KZJ3_9MAGN